MNDLIIPQICIHTQTHTHYIATCTHTYVHTPPPHNLHTHKHTHAYSHIHTNTHSHTYTHKHMPIHTHTCTQTHTHTHIHTHTRTYHKFIGPTWHLLLQVQLHKILLSNVIVGSSKFWYSTAAAFVVQVKFNLTLWCSESDMFKGLKRIAITWCI